MENNNKENQAQEILKEDKDEIINPDEIQRIIKLYLGREADESELQRFTGMHESELKALTDYVKIIEDRNSMDRDKSLNEEKTQMDAMKIGGDLANKEMKIKGGQNLDSLKEMAATPGMAGPMAGMPSVVPPMPQRPMIDGQGGCGSKASPNTKYIKDGKNFLVRFE